MLILTRKAGEAFRINDNIEITVTEINGDKIRIAIDAPKEVKILRTELFETGALNAEALKSSNTDLTKLRALMGEGRKQALPPPGSPVEIAPARQK